MRASQINKDYETLTLAGIKNPKRIQRLITDVIDFLGLDLTGLVVLTEAASGPYIVTPVIASLANAEHVIALTRDSKYAKVEAVVEQTRALEAICGVKRPIEIVAERNSEIFSEADMVTNLGFVRPIDREAVFAMKPTAVIPLMCESWEFRPGDIDLIACKERGIPVMGTNEDYPRLDIFVYSGLLCMKMLFEAEIEVHKSRVLIVSSDKFGDVITHQLSKSGANVTLVTNLKNDSIEILSYDVLVIADYTRTDTILGCDGDMTVAELVKRMPGITVIQFAGRVDETELKKCGMSVYPGIPLESHRMACTLASLGPRPVIELHAAGLKVGQALASARLYQCLSVNETIKYALTHSPAQILNFGE